MILICPNCSTRYSVSDAAFSGSGREVKCTRCGHRWHQTAEEPPAEAPAAAVESAPPAAEAPVEKRSEIRPVRAYGFGRPRSQRAIGIPLPSKAQAAGWAALVILIMVLVAGLLLGRKQVQAAWPATVHLYETLGFAAESPGAGLAFRNVSPDWRTGDSGRLLVVTGEIANLSENAKAVPRVRVVLRDDKDADVHSETIGVAVEQLGPGESAPFQVQIGGPPSGATGLALFFAPTG